MIRTGEAVRPIPAELKQTEITDAFFRPFLEKLREITLPDVLRKFLADGAAENYRRTARGEHGGHAGPPWYHGLICEVIRGASDLLSGSPDPEMEKTLDGIIDLIAAAQREDGWLHPYDMLMRPGQEWGLFGGNARWQHETYDCGCLIEAGVHHYRATGKTKLLSAAVKCAGYLSEHIGPPPKWNITCEHSLAESALISLEALFDEEPALAERLGAKRGEYLKLALFFIDSKGHNENRHQFPPFLQEYAQDHRPAREQREAVGHAVRATLFYTGMAEAAAMTGDRELSAAAQAIWRDIRTTKLHINGSVGAYRDDERFGQQYALPNDAYLETCAGVGFLFFADAMFRLTGDGTVWDAAESTIYNLLPAAVSADGTHYTYENPLESGGGRERWSWHGCPCCPPMLLKAAGALPSMIFAFGEKDIWVNLLIDAASVRNGTEVVLSSSADGKRLKIFTFEPKVLHLRIPPWAEGFELGRPCAVEKGYAVLPLPAGESEIGISFRIRPRRIEAHPWVEADRERVAFLRGPVLYAAEWEEEREIDPLLSEDPPEFGEDGSLTVGTEDGKKLSLIAYRDWNNRGPRPMRVWLRQKGKTADPRDLRGWDGMLYREWEKKG